MSPDAQSPGVRVRAGKGSLESPKAEGRPSKAGGARVAR